MPKFAALFLLFAFLQFDGIGQITQRGIVKPASRIDSLMNRRPWNVILPGKKIIVRRNDFFGLPTQPVKYSPGNSPGNHGRISSVPIDRNAGATCMDTSLRLLYRKDTLAFFNDWITKIRDGNILIPGFDYNWHNNQTAAHLFKITQEGDTLWSRSIRGGYPNQFIDVYNAFELNDNSILLAGDIFVPMPYNGRYDPMLIRVTSTGKLIWEKTFKTRLWDVDTTDGSIDILDCKQDAAGNMYLAGDVRQASLPRSALAIKMDLNGNILWSRGYAPGGFPQLTGVNVVNQKVTFVGRALSYYGNIMPIGIVADTGTGDTLYTTTLQSSNSNSDFWTSFYTNNLQVLANGNLALYGPGNSDPVYDSAHLSTHGGVIELTPDLQFVSSYVVRSHAPGNYYNTRITVFNDGSAAYTWLGNFRNYQEDVIYGSIQNEQVVKERLIHYSGASQGWISNFIKTDDGGQITTSMIADSVIQMGYIELMKLHNSDTSGLCLGKDSLNTVIEKEYYYNTPMYLDSVATDVLTENQRPFDGIYDNNFMIQSNCKQISFCDSLKLSTPRDTICANSTVFITIKKNKECGAIPLWTYDTTAASFYKINDSTIRATFHNPWEGMVKASITGCNTIQDSLHFTVLQAPPLLNLGPDTVLCPGNMILLNAGSGYASYKWQDGSTDSTFNVTTPGQYYVITKDACGGIFRDTVLVGPHPPIPFDLGPGISICKNDTVSINAPAGFTHYQWTPYNIIDDTLESVRVYPLMSTWYKVVAQQSPGCFASDSIYITVKTVPNVNLGNDTSFCANQSVTLDAGAGYNSYLWSNGAASEKITVNQQGVYSVKATLNGCSAYDTLNIKNVYPLPLFSLGNDTALCQGRVLQYNFNLSQALYKWSTGDSSNSETITQPGMYWLQVTQMGCVNSDTIDVTYNQLPVVSLGNDSTLCEKQTLLLNAYNNNASYLWQDGSTAPNYLVKNAGIYFVTANLNNCTASDTIAINYKALPFFSLGKDTFLCVGEPYILSPAINTNAKLLWQDGSNGASYKVSKDGIYFLTATNECGSYTDSVTINTGFCDIMMPSGFTPNGDGLNDIFKVKYPFPVKQFYLAIYDRWGEKIFETNKISEGWDGTLQGLPSPQSTYVWIISFTDINNKQQQLKGLVTLLR